MKRVTRLASALWLAALADVSAQPPPAQDAYFGLGLGSFAYEIDSNGSIFFDTTSAAIDFFGGFALSPDWTFEFSYRYTDKATVRGLPTKVADQLSFPGLLEPALFTTTARIEIATLRGLRYFRHDWGRWYLGIGASGAAVDTTFDVAGVGSTSANIHTSKNGLTLATGAEWAWPSFSLRLEYHWWDADMAGIGLSLHRRL